MITFRFLNLNYHAIPLQAKDQGIYYCISRNSLGERKATVQVYVIAPVTTSANNVIGEYDLEETQDTHKDNDEDDIVIDEQNQETGILSQYTVWLVTD